MTDYNHLNYISLCQFIPLNDKKQPIVQGWQHTTTKHNLHSHSVGLVCGAISGGVEVIDFDLKYDITGNLLDRYNALVNSLDKNILPKLVIQQTKNGGYHYIFRCYLNDSNQKLAQRYATATEQQSGEKVKVLIETRGEGGQVVVHPSPGYTLIQGTLDTIPSLTILEREILVDCARQFNEVFKEVQEYKQMEKVAIKGLSPWKDYDNRGDVIGLLQAHGWKIVETKGTKTYFKRPGNTDAKTSGNYDSAMNMFSVFTTSSIFETEKGYTPSAVYAMLECNGDFQASARKLLQEGYGEKPTTREVPNQLQSVTNSHTDVVKTTIPERDYLVQRADYIDRIRRWRDGIYPMGLSTGYPILDRYFLFKQGNLVIVNGFDNVGKSVVMWYLALLSSIKHGWRWLIYTAENDEFSFFRKMIELYWCHSIKYMPDVMINEALDFLEKHFVVIKSDQVMYNYKDILAIAENELKFGKFHALLIDPYNALDITIDPKTGLNTHEYHYKAISEIKLFTKMHHLSVYINMHVVSSAGRGHGKGEIPAPGKSDTEGGNKFANKADEFITIHRHVGDLDRYLISELHIRKVKETETGGQVTPFEFPVKLVSRQGVVGFDELESGYNPIAEMRGNQHKPTSINKPYEDNFNPF